MSSNLDCRLYTITNMYTIGIHAGIQTAHLVHKLFTKYDSEEGKKLQPGARSILHTWAEEDKTIIVKRSGGHHQLGKDYVVLRHLSSMLDLPHTQWRESKESLNGVLTCIGVVVPRYIWGMTKAENEAETYGGSASVLQTELQKYHMAI